MRTATMSRMRGVRYVIDHIAPILAPVVAHYGHELDLDSVSGLKRIISAIVEDNELLRSEADRYAAIENLVKEPDAELCGHGNIRSPSACGTATSGSIIEP